MSRLSIILTGVVLVAGVAMTPVLATGHEQHQNKAVEARHAQMSLYSWNLGRLGAMARGKAPYDAAAASAAAANLAALAAMSAKGMWPEGSDNVALPGKNRALPAIWQQPAVYAEREKQLAVAAAALAETAGQGLDALKAGIGAVGKGCGDCHRQFRQPK